MAQKVIGIDCMFSGAVIEIPYNGKEEVESGQEIIYKDAEEKEEYGIIKYVDKESEDPDKILFTSRILRKATPNDSQKLDNHIDSSKEALSLAKDLVQKHELQMEIFRAGYSFDGTKVHFMFTAEERVDFREMVKDLAKELKKQIYLRQVGPRDRAKMIGGYGKCGRPLCCSTFLGKLESINMDMVRVQGLEGKGSSKLSGACGKLLCCLKYEVVTYKEMRKGMPNIGSLIRVKKSVAAGDQEARVVAVDILNQKLKVVFKDNNYETISLEDIEKILKEGYEQNDRETVEESN